MNTLTKFAFGLMGQLRAQPALDEGAPMIELPAPRTDTGEPLMQAMHLPPDQHLLLAQTVGRPRRTARGMAPGKTA